MQRRLTYVNECKFPKPAYYANIVLGYKQFQYVYKPMEDAQARRFYLRFIIKRRREYP